MTVQSSPDIVDAIDALLEQYDFGPGSCLGVMGDGSACFKGSFLAKLEKLREARACCPAGNEDDRELVETLSYRAIDYTLDQLCRFLGVNPADVTWDAATETVDGDVQAVIGNILRAKFGEDWGPKDAVGGK